MEVQVDQKLFGLAGNDTVFANGATYDSIGVFKYDQPLGDSTQAISIVNETLNVAVDFEVLSRKKCRKNPTYSIFSLEWDLFR